MTARYKSMKNNLRQLPALTFSTKPEGILRGWDLTVERNEKPHLVTVSQSLVFVSVGHNVWLVGKITTFSGHYPVEQASTVSFTDMEEGVAPMPSISS